MRVLALVALVALVAVANASAAWNELTAPSGVTTPSYAVSQIGPRPGTSTISDSDINNDFDVRDSAYKASLTGIAHSASFFAPYASCWYQYLPNGTNVWRFLAGPVCTKYSEFDNNGNVVTPAASAVALNKAASTFAVSNGGKTYSFTLQFSVDAGYAGVAFEFLNLNVSNPTDADTRCGVSFDDIAQPDSTNNTLVSPHTAGGTTTILIQHAASYVNAHTSDNGQWNLGRNTTYTTSVRVANVNYSIGDFNNALKNCGWSRNESNANVTLFQAEIRATTVQQGRSIRGVLYKSLKETAIQIAIAFNTSVNATSPVMEAQSNITTIQEVVKQVFDPTTFTAYLLLYTSSQGPYQLVGSSATCDASVSNNPCLSWSGKSTNEGLGATSVGNVINFDSFGTDITNDIANLKLTSTRYADLYGNTNSLAHRAKCWPATILNAAAGSTATESNYAATQSTSTHYDVCGQFWSIQLNVPSNCPDVFGSQSAGLLTLNGQWKFSFTVTCHPSYKGSCATPLQNTVVFTTNTASDTYCARIVDTVSATASLSVFQDIGRSQAQDQFVFGTTSYFTATVTSTIGVQSLFSEEVAITTGGAFNNNQGTSQTIANPNVWIAPDSTVPRQILYANGYNTQSTVSGGIASTYFAASVEADTTCTGLSGQNTLYSSGAVAPAVVSGVLSTSCYFNSTANVAGYKLTNWNIQQWSFNTEPAGSPLLQVNNTFQFQWDGSSSNATGDFAQTTVVRWLGRVRYDDATQKRRPSFLGAMLMPNELNTVDGSSATVSRVVTGAPSSEASPAQSPITTTTIAVAAAAVAAVAVMAVAAVVVLRSRNVKAEEETNLESVTLGSSSVNLAQ